MYKKCFSVYYFNPTIFANFQNVGIELVTFYIGTNQIGEDAKRYYF